MRRTLILTCFAVLLAGCGSSVSAPSATTLTPNPTAGANDWLQFDGSAQHTGVNTNEATLKANTVGGLQRLWAAKLSDPADSTPVVIGSLTLPSGKTGAVIYVTTKKGALVALDANTGAQLWQQTTKGPNVTNSSPAIAPDKQSIFSYGLDGKVHKYNTATGTEITGNGWPLTTTLMTNVEKGSSALTIANDRLYATMSGYFGDGGHYEGHVVSLPLAGGTPAIWNALCSDKKELLSPNKGDPNYCSDEKAGMWSRPGMVQDPETGVIYAVTGNGSFSLTPAKAGGTSWGNSIIALAPDLSQVRDSYTPANLSVLNDADLDLGSTGPALLPKIANSKTPLLLVQGGKDGTLRLINRQNMSGQGGPSHLGGEVATTNAPGPLNKGLLVFAQPVVWTDAQGTVWVFVTSELAAVTGYTAGYQVQTDSTGKTTLHQAWQIHQKSNSPVLAGGVLYLATSGKILGLDPATGKTLWDSSAAQAGGNIGSIHWESPIVVNGRLFMPDESGNVYAYGLK
ncbi:MAG: PQQ-binding-like beta-propeller repeat protein [Ktedonobacterales bacterium]|nr:PQQ-binding-like beta-propeller repeat protein [Ktedonobacterales bacterium]